MEHKRLSRRSVERASLSSSLRRQSTTPSSSLSRWTTTPSDSNQPRALGLTLLRSPQDASIDFVFVHGLGGHLRKTWNKTNLPEDFWPQEWLPKHAAFDGARIHSFGYIADIKKGKDTCLNIHHLAKNLVGELDLSPQLEGVNTPIVLVGHSMGGLVIKKAYVLARQDPTYHGLAARIRSMVFLATPHRGCDSAKLVNDILQASSISRLYIGDLQPDSGSIQSINDDFRHYSDNLSLWSFYETQKLSLGRFLSKVIVDHESAVLGYPGERQMPINADHRSICKFESPEDPNYLIIRNALASITHNLLHQELQLPDAHDRDELTSIEELLQVEGIPEHDLISAEDARLNGTCDWFSTKSSYVKWMSFDLNTPAIFWLRGKPASGKSVLAGSVIDRLRDLEVPCSYFFFKHGNKKRSTLSYCLRSLAYQMACANTDVRQTILKLSQDDSKLDHDSEKTIWRKLFVSGIFSARLEPHYWVIDGLDECLNASPLFDSMLAKLDESIPLRIFITSRETGELERLFLGLGERRVHSDPISVEDTLADIQLLAEAKSKSLLAMDDESRLALATKVVEKSQGSFLWTALVFNELSDAHGERATQKVLDEVPPGMEALYQRTLNIMSSTTRGKPLAKAILSWVVCTTRPLTIQELEGALEFDINDTFPKLSESIIALCGQLVMVDRFNKVQMIHATAREFLLQDGLESEFAINIQEAHTRIARSCLSYLNGSEFKPPRGGRRPSAITIARRIDFSKYACESFSSHLARSSPGERGLLALSNSFLAGNILSWIEYVASTGDLRPLVRTAKNLGRYLDACATEISPLLPQVQILGDWAVDLSRITAKFSDALVVASSAIYTHIPAFCPTQSAISKLVTQGRRISVVGLSNRRWDDRLTCFEFHQGQASALIYGDKFFAVGLLNGTITLYHATTCQEHRMLNHGETVKFLQFKPHSDMMASCGMRKIHIWDIRTGEKLHSLSPPSRPMAMAFEGSSLIVASNKRFLASWNIEDGGTRLPDRPWRDSDDETAPSRRPPCAVDISLAHNMLAVAYSGQEITLWDLEQDFYYGSCGKKMATGETSTHPITAMVFNPNPSIGLLAVSYLDGELAILDPFQDQELEMLRAHCHALAASPDGQFLAGGGGSGVVQIYEFDTLKLIYRVNSSNFFIKELAFSSDGFQLADIRGKQCNVWAPSVLLQGLPGDDSSDGSLKADIDAKSLDSDIKITCMVVDPTQEYIICGKSDGSVCCYALKTGSELMTIYRHKSLVRTITWWPARNLILSVDASNGVFAWNLQKAPREEWKPSNAKFQMRLEYTQSITQLLPSKSMDKFLLSTRDSVHLWDINGKEERKYEYSSDTGARWWLSHPSSASHIIRFDGKAARIYSWRDLAEVASYPLVSNELGLQLKNVVPHLLAGKQSYLLELMDSNGAAKTRGLGLVDGSLFAVAAEGETTDKGSPKLQPDLSSAAVPRPVEEMISKIPTAITDRITHIIGLNGRGEVTYLDRQSWVCSVNLENVTHGILHYSRHFFVPYDWFSATWGVVAALTKRDVVFSRGNEIAVVKGGLEFAESIALEGP
ncbi:Fc.00g059310.m01.CDS01 [Cosmosporella sp. VM-42]